MTIEASLRVKTLLKPKRYYKDFEEGGISGTLQILNLYEHTKQTTHGYKNKRERDWSTSTVESVVGLSPRCAGGH